MSGLGILAPDMPSAYWGGHGEGGCQHFLFQEALSPHTTTYVPLSPGLFIIGNSLVKNKQSKKPYFCRSKISE
jgi:hypothetical protein